jgi:hypothetical protein
MDKLSASEVMKSIQNLSKNLNGIDALLRNIPDDGERKELLTSLAKIIVELDFGLIRPIVRQYPDFDPDR